MTKDPGRGDLRIRLGISLMGLVLLTLAAIARGVDGGAGGEVLLIGGAFFGLTAVLALRRMTGRGNR